MGLIIWAIFDIVFVVVLMMILLISSVVLVHRLSKLMLRIFKHLLVIIVLGHRLRLLVNEHVVSFELLGEGALDDRAHALELASQRLQLGTARSDRLL